MALQTCRHAPGRHLGLWHRLAAVLFAAVFAAHPLAAQAKEVVGRHAVLVMDANTGRVLYERSADKRRYPASLTKLMTLYLIFEAIEQGRLTLDTKVRFSAHAVAAPPSRLIVDEGDEISIIDVIKALIVKSANNVAVAVAEHIAGSEERFAELMTRKAHELGMKDTQFRNAHGLPNSEQFTTAEDMMTLALALQDRFPKYYPLFATRTFKWGKKTYRNHNRLLFRYKGMDGMKTGYIRASGFNLVASARRGKKHVVVAYFGGRTSRRRNRAVRKRLDAAFPKASTRKTREPVPAIGAEAKSEAQSSEAQSSEAQSEAKSQRKAGTSSHAKSAPAEADRVVVAATPQRIERASVLTEGDAARVRPVHVTAARVPADDGEAAAETAPPPVPTPTGGFQVQIGAFYSAGEAERLLAQVRERAGPVIGPHAARTSQVKRGKKVLFRARYVGYEDRADAAGVCSRLKRLDIDCLVMKAR